MSCAPLTAASDSPAPPPATVQGAVPESALTTVKLTAEAAARLGIETVPVEERSHAGESVLPGEIVVPPGHRLTVSAPFAGSVSRPRDRDWPTTGQRVSAGEVLADLLPALFDGEGAQVYTTGERIASFKLHADLSTAITDAESQAAASHVQTDAARIAVARAKELLDENVGSRRAYDEATAALATAEAALDAAGNRLKTLRANHADFSAHGLLPLAIHSPLEGVLSNANVAPGMVVSPGHVLFEVLQLDPVWVRVPVLTSDWLRFANATNAAVTRLADPRHSPGSQARRIPAPPAANPIANTIDVFFSLSNPDGSWRPGERVAVKLHSGEAVTRPTAPWSAVVFDIHGGAWVYVQTETFTFARRRVEIEQVDGDTAFIRRGVKLGDRVVSVGVAELYGTEFGIGK
ncbi:MAG: efflux RND transporter periplasmic adaptor subunit [Phycisphaerales bacterium]|nr:efflux RND transporter periplasmic adaptor subunit [Phycisphaerales bacterium]